MATARTASTEAAFVFELSLRYLTSLAECGSRAGPRWPPPGPGRPPWPPATPWPQFPRTTTG